MEIRKRVVSVIFAFTVLLAMLSSVCFIAVESDHDCKEEDCPICCQISICENTIKNLGKVLSIAVISFVVIQEIHFFFHKINIKFSNPSLVSLKVKLSN